MSPIKTTMIYFSPTSTTRKTLEAIAEGMGIKAVNTIDITNPEVRATPLPCFNNELVLIGAPVYAGRIPVDAANYFKTLKGTGTPAVLVVVYGNREFDDALLELKDISNDCGFTAIAAGAFIGEHSFSTDDFPVAQNRPDAEDLKTAGLFGEKITAFLDHNTTLKKQYDLNIPGNFPYKDGMKAGPIPFIHVNDLCDNCGICLTVCPKNAIDEESGYETIEENCILCAACIKACPTGARIVKGPMKDKAKALNESCALRKEPRMFLPAQD